MSGIGISTAPVAMPFASGAASPPAATSDSSCSLSACFRPPRTPSNKTDTSPENGVVQSKLLADKIILMTNGPEAKIAEIVVNTLPRSRSHHTLHKEPHYYPIRNHLVDFLINRSRLYQTGSIVKLKPLRRLA